MSRHINPQFSQFPGSEQPGFFSSPFNGQQSFFGQPPVGPFNQQVLFNRQQQMPNQFYQPLRQGMSPQYPQNYHQPHSDVEEPLWCNYTRHSQMSLNQKPINEDAVKTVRIYKLLETLSDDEDLNQYYWCNPLYVWQLFANRCCIPSQWLGSAYVTLNRDNVVTFTTPVIDVHVERDILRIRTTDENGELTDEEVRDGLIPILKLIRKVCNDSAELERKKADDSSKNGKSISPADDIRWRDTLISHTRLTSSLVKLASTVNTPSKYKTFMAKIDGVEPGLSVTMNKSIRSIYDALLITPGQYITGDEESKTMIYIDHDDDDTLVIRFISHGLMFVGDLEATDFADLLRYVSLTQPRLLKAVVDIFKLIKVL